MLDLSARAVKHRMRLSPSDRFASRFFPARGEVPGTERFVSNARAKSPKKSSKWRHPSLCSEKEGCRSRMAVLSLDQPAQHLTLPQQPFAFVFAVCPQQALASSQQAA